MGEEERSQNTLNYVQPTGLKNRDLAKENNTELFKEVARPQSQNSEALNSLSTLAEDDAMLQSTASLVSLLENELMSIIQSQVSEKQKFADKSSPPPADREIVRSKRQ